jgi:poly-gamma-glutamate capsule biosynthesis protein CapA/YwtB (metallophosphatase superfamily)
MVKKDIILYAVGDIGPDRPDPGSIFRHVTRVLKQGNINFCQLEVNLSHRGTGLKENARDPGIAAALKNTGFKVISFAGNHCLDAGQDAFFDTISNIKKQGLSIIGVGNNITEARKPAIIDCQGSKIAFLAYNSVAKNDYWAEDKRPGCAPLRAWTVYESVEPVPPGMPAFVHTFPYRDDLKAMTADILKAKKEADIVVISMHCGVHITPAVIADYQIDYAHAAIDAGADLILQHHSHILKGIEVYRGKTIFYGLGNFALELHFMTREWADTHHIKKLRKILNPDWNPPYPDYPSFPFPPDSRKTILVKCTITNKKMGQVSFLPVIINKKGEPEILSVDDARFREVMLYLEDITRAQGFKTRFIITGNEVGIKN